MKSDRDDPIVETLLQETLGGQTPPDLSARILQAWAAQRNVTEKHPVDRALKASAQLPPAASTTPIPVGSPATRSATPVVIASPRKRSAVSQWLGMGITVAAAIALVAVVVRFQPTEKSVVQKEPPGKRATTGSSDKPVQPTPSTANKSKPAVEAPPTVVQQRPSPTPVPELAPTPVPAPAPAVSPNEAIVKALPPTVQPSSNREIIQFINTQFTSTWKANGVTPAAAASDSEWCRRTYLRLLGRIPTVDELEAFTRDRNPDRRSKLVQALLHSELYGEEFARHWGTVWTNILIGRTTGTSPSEVVSREGLQQYLTSAFQKKVPFDRLIAELLTAEGSAKPGTADFNGAVNFLLAGFEEDATVATSRVSRLFLGLNLQCAQCHNHPTNDWDQRDYWALNAFLRQMAVEKRGSETRLVDRDLVAKKGDAREAEVYYQTPAGIMKVAYPRFIDGTEISHAGELSEVNRRQKLAELVTHSPQMPRALANRVWAQFFGYAFTQPVDDIGRGNQPSQPEVLDHLAREFAAHNYDLRSLMQWIVLSEPFQRSSKVSAADLVDAPEAGTTPLFSRYYTRQMQMEEVFDSLQIAARMRKKAGTNGDGVLARQDWLAQFSRPMATDDAAEESTFDGSLKQSLIMLNGDLMRKATNPEYDGLLRSVVQGPLPFAQKVDHLFLAALTRVPTAKEKAAAQKLLAVNQGKEALALSDLWWALLNSNEFILDH